jgi:peptide/nickel transport system substrate-binding protein
MRLLAILFTGLLLAACHSGDTDRGLLRVGLAQMPITMDPRFATDAASSRVQDFIHRGLFKLDDSFNVQGDLAERWDNPEPLLWRFYLRHGVTFSDGSSLTAADVVATIRAILNPELISPLKASFAAIESIDAESDNVVMIRLSKPDASLLTRLNIGILPQAIASAGHQSRQTIGCGPYKLQAWHENTLTLVRVAENQGSASTIRFSGVKDPVTRVLKMTRGELDFIQNDLPPHLLPYIQDQQKLKIQTRPSTTFTYIGLNIQDDTIKDVRVRRALALALDRGKLKKALFADLPKLAETVLTSSHWASSTLPALPFDKSEAGKLLDEAGFPRAEDGIRFTLNYRTSTDPTRLRLATAIAAMWGEIGIKVSIESLEWGGFYARIKRGDFQVFSLAWVGITDPDIYRWILHSSMWPPKGANRGRYANSDVDKWLDLAAAANGQHERKALYAKVAQQMQDDVVYLPLWYDPVIAVTGPRVSGFVPKPDGNLLGLLHIQLGEQK